MYKFSELQKRIKFVSVNDGRQTKKRRKQSVFDAFNDLPSEVSDLTRYLVDTLKEISEDKSQDIFADQLSIQVSNEHTLNTSDILTAIQPTIPFYHVEIKGSDYSSITLDKDFFEKLAVLLGANPQLQSMTIHVEKVDIEQEINISDYFKTLSTYTKINFTGMEWLNLEIEKYQLKALQKKQAPVTSASPKRIIEPTDIAKQNLELVPKEWPSTQESQVEVASHMEMDIQQEQGVEANLETVVEDDIDIQDFKQPRIEKKYYFKTFFHGEGAPEEWKKIKKQSEIKDLANYGCLKDFVPIVKEKWDYNDDDYAYFETVFLYSKIVATQGKESAKAIVDISYEAMQQYIEHPYLEFDFDHLPPGFVVIPYLEVFSQQKDVSEKEEFYHKNSFVLHYDKDLALNITSQFPAWTMRNSKPRPLFSTFTNTPDIINEVSNQELFLELLGGKEKYSDHIHKFSEMYHTKGRDFLNNFLNDLDNLRKTDEPLYSIFVNHYLKYSQNYMEYANENVMQQIWALTEQNNQQQKKLWIALHPENNSDLVIEMGSDQFIENVLAVFDWHKKIRKLFEEHETTDTIVFPKELKFKNVPHPKMALKRLYQIIFNARPYLQAQINELSDLDLGQYGSIIPVRMEEKILVSSKITIGEGLEFFNDDNYQPYYGFDFDCFSEHMDIIEEQMNLHSKEKNDDEITSHSCLTKPPFCNGTYSFEEFVTHHFYRFFFSKIRSYTGKDIEPIIQRVRNFDGYSDFRKIQLLYIIGYLLYRDTTHDIKQVEKPICSIIEYYEKEKHLRETHEKDISTLTPLNKVISLLKNSKQRLSAIDVSNCLELYTLYKCMGSSTRENFNGEKIENFNKKYNYFGMMFSPNLYDTVGSSYITIYVSFYPRFDLDIEKAPEQLYAFKKYFEPYKWSSEKKKIPSLKPSGQAILDLISYFNFSECYQKEDRVDKNNEKLEGDLKLDIAFCENYFKEEPQQIKLIEFLSLLKELDFTFITLNINWEQFTEFFEEYIKIDQPNLLKVKELLIIHFSNYCTVQYRLSDVQSLQENTESISQDLGGESPKALINRFKKEGVGAFEKISESNYSTYKLCIKAEVKKLVGSVCEQSHANNIHVAIQYFEQLLEKSNSLYDFKRNSSLLYYFIQSIQLLPPSNFFVEHLIKDYILYSKSHIKDGKDFFERVEKINSFKLEAQASDKLLEVEDINYLGKIGKLLALIPKRFYLNFVTLLPKTDSVLSEKLSGVFSAIKNKQHSIDSFIPFILKLLKKYQGNEKSVNDLFDSIKDAIEKSGSLAKILKALAFLNSMMPQNKKEKNNAQEDYAKAFEKLLILEESETPVYNFQATKFYSINDFLQLENIQSYSGLVERFTKKCLPQEEDGFNKEKFAEYIKEFNQLHESKISLSPKWVEAIEYFIESIADKKSDYRRLSLSELLTKYKELYDKKTDLCRYGDYSKNDEEKIANTVDLLAIQFEIGCRTSYNGTYQYPRIVQQIPIIFSVLANRNLFYQIDASEGKTLTFQHLTALELYSRNTVHVLTDRILLSKRDFKHSKNFLNLLGYKTTHLLDTSPREAYQKGGAHFTTSHELNNFISRQEHDYFSPEPKHEELFSFTNPTTLLMDEFDRSSDETPAVVSQPNKSVTVGILSQKEEQDVLERFYNIIIDFVDYREPNSKVKSIPKQNLLDDICNTNTYNNMKDSPKKEAQILWEFIEKQMHTSFLTNERVYYQLYVLMTAAKQSRGLFDLEKERSLDKDKIVEIDKIDSKRQNAIGVQNKVPKEGLKFQNGAHQFLIVRKMRARKKEQDNNKNKNVINNSYPFSLPLEEISTEHKNILKLCEMSKKSGGKLIAASATKGEGVDSIKDFENYFDLVSISVPKHQIDEKSLLKDEQPQYIDDNYDNKEIEHFKAILSDILEKQKTGRPVLVNFETVRKCDAFHEFLLESNYNFTENNLQKYTTEDTLKIKQKTILEKAKQAGVITISNIMSIGFDIQIVKDSEIDRVGGLHSIIADVFTESEEFQAQRRAARNGCKGSTKTIVCCKDEQTYKKQQNEKMHQQELKRNKTFYKSHVIMFFSEKSNAWLDWLLAKKKADKITQEVYKELYKALLELKSFTMTMFAFEWDGQCGDELYSFKAIEHLIDKWLIIQNDIWEKISDKTKLLTKPEELFDTKEKLKIDILQSCEKLANKRTYSSELSAFCDPLDYQLKLCDSKGVTDFHLYLAENSKQSNVLTKRIAGVLADPDRKKVYIEQVANDENIQLGMLNNTKEMVKNILTLYKDKSLRKNKFIASDRLTHVENILSDLDDKSLPDIMGLINKAITDSLADDQKKNKRRVAFFKRVLGDSDFRTALYIIKKNILSAALSIEDTRNLYKAEKEFLANTLDFPIQEDINVGSQAISCVRKEFLKKDETYMYSNMLFGQSLHNFLRLERMKLLLDKEQSSESIVLNTIQRVCLQTFHESHSDGEYAKKSLEPKKIAFKTAIKQALTSLGAKDVEFVYADIDNSNQKTLKISYTHATASEMNNEEKNFELYLSIDFTEAVLVSEIKLTALEDMQIQEFN